MNPITLADPIQASEQANAFRLEYDPTNNIWALVGANSSSNRAFVLYDASNSAGKDYGMIEFTRGFYMGAAKDLYGAGSPEGVVTAAPGSTYRNTSGGAGTSFYIKESGTGNTGWVAK